MADDLAARRLAGEIAGLRREVSSLSRARQIAHSTVPVVVEGETVDMPVADLLGAVPRVEIDLADARSELAVAAVNVAAVQDQVTLIEDGTLPALQEAIDIAQATADSTVKVHFEADLGAGVKPVLNDTSDRGDLYYRLDGQVERWQNSTLGWVLVEDTLLAKAIADLRAAEDAIDNLNLVKLPALQSELDAAEATIAQHTTDLSGLDSRLTTVAADLDTAEASLATAKTDLDAAEATIAQHTTTLSDHSTRLTDAESDVGTLNSTTIPNLNTSLAEKLPRVVSSSGAASYVVHDVLSFSKATPNYSDNLVIRTTIPAVNKMVRIRITGYNYSGTRSEIDLDIAAYVYTATSMLHRTVTNKGTAQVGVRFAYVEGSPRTFALILSPPPGNWQYVSINVPEVLLSYSGAHPSQAEGWTVTTMLEADVASSFPYLAGPSSARDIEDSNQLTQGWRTTGTTTIDGGRITADSVTAGQIAADAITATELAANAVYAGAIQANAVTANAIAADAVTANKIAADAVTAREIAANSITADELAVGAITATKAVIATGAILSAQIKDAAIVTAKIADAAITNAKVGDLAAEKITAGTIAAARIGARTITADKIVADSLTSNEIAADAITANELAVGAITANKAVIANSAIQTAQIADLAVTNAKVTGLSATKITTDTLGADRIGARTISADKLLVGDFANYFNDPEFLHPVGYSPWTRVVTAGIGGIQKAGTGAQHGQYITATDFPVVPGETYVATGTRTNIAGGTGDIGVYVQKWNGTAWVFATLLLTLSAAGTVTSAPFVVPSDAQKFRLGFFTQANMTSATTVRLSGLHIRKLVAGELIVDGAVTAAKIEAGAVTTAKLDAGAVTAEKIVSGAVTTEKMTANTINGDRIAVGTLNADRITANTITADQLSANAIDGKTITGATIRTAATGKRTILGANGLEFAEGSAQFSGSMFLEPGEYGLWVHGMGTSIEIGSGPLLGGTDWSGQVALGVTVDSAFAAVIKGGVVVADRLVQGGEPTAYRMAAGKDTSPTVAIAQYGNANFTVEFPPGRFTHPPVVTATTASGRMSAAVQNVTTAGCTIQLQNNSNAAGYTLIGGVNFHWQAVQMLTTAAEG